MQKYATTCPGAHSTATTPKFNSNPLANKNASAEPRLANDAPSPKPRSATRQRTKRSITAEALKKVSPPVELGWQLDEQRQKRLPESVWNNPDRYKSVPVSASPASTLGPCESPPKQPVTNGLPSKVCPVVRVNNPANAAALEKGDLEPLLLNTSETCRLLGGICPRTLDRLEKRGLIRSLPLLRHKMYAFADIESCVEGLRKWNA